MVDAIFPPGSFGEFGVRVEGQGGGQFEPERVAVASPTELLRFLFSLGEASSHEQLFTTQLTY